MRVQVLQGQIFTHKMKSDILQFSESWAQGWKVQTQNQTSTKFAVLQY